MYLIKTVITCNWDDNFRQVLWDDAPGDASAYDVQEMHSDKVAQYNGINDAFKRRRAESTIFDPTDPPDHFTMDDLEQMPIRYLKYFV